MSRIARPRRRPRRRAVAARSGGTGLRSVEAGGRRLVAKVGPGSPGRSRRVAPARRGARSPTGARRGARRGRPPRHHCGRPDAPDRPPRRGARAQPGAVAPGALPAVGRRLVVGRAPAPSTRRPGPTATPSTGPGSWSSPPAAGSSMWSAPVAARLGELLPPGGPALVHGDLWWGNVLFGRGRQRRGSSIRPSTAAIPRRTWRCSPSSARCPDRLLHAYAEVQPLHAGWQERDQPVPTAPAPRPRRAVRRRLPRPGRGRGARFA